jgi:hypothetical protein
MRLQTTLKSIVIAASLFAASASRANVVVDVNNALVIIIQNTSSSLVDGPPEVAREIAMVDGAMFDAVNAASGSPYAPIAYSGGAVSGASADAAALQAALTVMNNLYGSGSLYQQYEGVTGATYYPSIPAYANALIGPTVVQMNNVAAQIGIIKAELAALGSGSSITAGISLGTAAGQAMLAARANDGANAASLRTLTPFVPPNEGNPGVYVPPTGRPAMTPTWGTVQPFGMTSAKLAALEAAIPPHHPYTATNQDLTSQAYDLEVLQTECQGTSNALPANIAATCLAAGFEPESSAEAAAALFWNDPGGTAQPPGHWLQIADTVAANQGLSLLQTARATAMVGLALCDAGIGAWAIKYVYNAWRPVTAIRDCAAWSPNFTTCDTTWSSLIVTPPHPDYVAGHPAFSGAAATALTGVLATDNVTFTSTSATYCNGGQATFGSIGNVNGCRLNGALYLIATAGCANGATPTHDVDGNVNGCTLNGVAQSVIGGDCNNAGSEPVLNADYTANPLYNGSPLICPIAETFTSLSQASAGFLGAEFSRVVGGIHTPAAVVDAVALGNNIGALGQVVQTAATGAGALSAQSMSWIHPVAALALNNGLLLVGVSAGSRTPAVTSVTYGGIPLTLLGAQLSSRWADASLDAELWYLLAPPAGQHTVLVSLANSVPVVVGAMTFNGVQQAAPFGQPSGGGADSDQACVTLANQPAPLVATVLAASHNVTISAGSGQTLTWSANSNPNNLTNVHTVLGTGMVGPGAPGATICERFRGGETDYTMLAVPLNTAP